MSLIFMATRVASNDGAHPRFDGWRPRLTAIVVAMLVALGSLAPREAIATTSPNTIAVAAVGVAPMPTAAGNGLPAVVPAGFVAPVPASTVDVDRANLATVIRNVALLQNQAVGASTDASMARLREQTTSAQSAADSFAHARQGEIVQIDVKLRALGTPNGKARRRLDAADQRERHLLMERRALLVAELAQARAAAVAANRLFTEVSQRRRTAFDARTLDRTASPLEADFWSSLTKAQPGDTQRLGELGDEAVATALAAAEPAAGLTIILSLVIAVVLAWPLRRIAMRFIYRWTVRPGQSARFHHSARALVAVVVGTVLPGVGAVALNLGLQWGGVLSSKATALAQAVVVAVVWGALVVNLGRQLAGGKGADDRLLTASAALASRIQPLSWLVALITGAGFIVTRVNSVVGASLAATVAANCVSAVAYAAVFGLILLALSEDRPAVDDTESDLPPARGATITLVALTLTLAIIVTLGAVLTGYTTLAILVASQTFWISVLVATTYLLLRFTDDALTELYKPGGWVTRLLVNVINLRTSTVEQLGVITSAVVQVLIVLGALSLALTPFGRNGDVVASSLAGTSHAIHLGSLAVSPRSLAVGVGCLLLGLGIVHLTQRWLDQRFLPVTEWDVGVRNSVSTGVRYLGVGLVLLWALTAAGLGFGQIALIASALSVGIGFGLQQIVQNFVSGIILLIERPIKVGDLVTVGGVEGDIRNIRVRATEIMQADRTTLIVPNSDLITKPVQNKTLGDPRGRVQLQLTIGSAADTTRAITILREALDANVDVIKKPGPTVLVDSLTPSGSVNLVAFAIVASPRVIPRVRSDLYVAVIAALGEAKIGFDGSSGQKVVVEPGPEFKAFTAALSDQLPARREEADRHPDDAAPDVN
ncbi:DUF3772 domain-containing protein [Polymorphobacter sp. PAMC 29334]|uniref:DUF3772 domain-containing protein n=1 Tax=Polymorphobacter sp. PAMC 29334 TaxID=2862331 RepID=UPI001C750849|nr:DUF3772 domain-containing protein [Polymorphobacter sp. PAMC 29334]QYE36435.1 DUF3772 domain-containing protein [Polymorphobacter sp. PAMC 29334]